MFNATSVTLCFNTWFDMAGERYAGLKLAAALNPELKRRVVDEVIEYYW